MAQNKKSDKDRTDADIIKLVQEILLKAVQSGASDVHFEPTIKQFEIRYRLDGVLNTVATFPEKLGSTIIARLKVMAGLISYRSDIPQEGRIQLEGVVADRVTDQRLAVFPTIYGERAVVRLFYSDQGLEDLEQLGLSGYVTARLMAQARQCRGVLLVSGPAGSGKTTTLAAFIRYILKVYPGKSIITVEDPVERRIEGVTQIQVSQQGDLDFPSALRSLMRQDPEVIMIGEIRDSETAKIAIEAALTGHMLLSTVHSGSPGGAMLRLLEMGIEPYQVSSSVTAIINQRLVRKLCQACRQWNQSNGSYEPVGCDQCLHTGFHGRTLLAEYIEMDDDIRQAVLTKEHTEVLESMFRHRGLMPVRQKGLIKVQQGITSASELAALAAR